MSELKIHIAGEDAQELATELGQVFRSEFGEELIQSTAPGRSIDGTRADPLTVATFILAIPPALLATSPPQDPARSDGGRTGFVEAVAGAYEAGLAIAFEGLFAGEARRRVGIPTYPFQRRRHWV